MGWFASWILAQHLAQHLAAGDPGATDPGAYLREVEAWRVQRQERLKADGGWLTVAGLFWLKPGANRFGSGAANDIVLPASAPARAGVFTLDASGKVTLELESGVTATIGGAPVEPHRALRTDAGTDEPDVVALGRDLTLQIIDRGGKLGVRLKDAQSPARRAFKGLAWFPVDPAWRVKARVLPQSAPAAVAVPSVIGVTLQMAVPGAVEFDLAGKTHRLTPVLEPGETRWFFIFRDATSSHGTYGAGRFLYADPPRDGVVILDFNEAYSPPCAFTPYATCPLPPAGNRLPIAVEAGERYEPHAETTAH